MQILRDIFDFNKELGRATNTGQSVVAVSIDAFVPPAEFKRSVDAMVRTIRESPRLPGVDRIWLPGEQSHTKRLDREKNGIPLPPSLKKSLDDVVDSCVNQVGVNVNTASYHLLGRVSGIGPGLARAIVDHRVKEGLFKSRAALLAKPCQTGSSPPS